MAYSLTPTTKAPILKADLSQLQSGQADITFSVAGIVNFASGASGLELLGLAVGTVDVTIGGATHTVTVSPDPFEWSLGTPVAK
jgi:hypothetical protein